MIKYATVLKAKEKNNPIPFLRVTYLMSNFGDLVKCYGRSIRFPGNAKLYEAEMRLALADVIMQCELLVHETGKILQKPTNTILVSTDKILTEMVTWIAILSSDLEDVNVTEAMANELLDDANLLCEQYNWNYEDTRHIGFLHVMERYEQFEREEWK